MKEIVDMRSIKALEEMLEKSEATVMDGAIPKNTDETVRISLEEYTGLIVNATLMDAVRRIAHAYMAAECASPSLQAVILRTLNIDGKEVRK